MRVGICGVGVIASVGIGGGIHREGFLPKSGGQDGLVWIVVYLRLAIEIIGLRLIRTGVVRALRLLVGVGLSSVIVASLWIAAVRVVIPHKNDN